MENIISSSPAALETKILLSSVILIIYNVNQKKNYKFFLQGWWSSLLVQNCRLKSSFVQSFLWPFLLTAKKAKNLVTILLNSSRSIINQCQIFILVANHRGQWCWLIKISSSAFKKMLFKPLHFFQRRKFFWVPN